MVQTILQLTGEGIKSSVNSNVPASDCNIRYVLSANFLYNMINCKPVTRHGVKGQTCHWAKDAATASLALG